MAGTLTPTPFQTVLDTDGVAVSGALIYTYVGGTTTNATTYADASLATPNANPIVADAAGRFVAYLPAGGNFKFLYKTAAGATIEEQDNILSVPGAAVNLDIEGTVGEAVTAGQVCYLSTGAEATPLTAGLWYLTDADFAPTSTTCQSIGVAVSAIAINTAGTIRLAGTATMATAVVIGSTYYVSATAGAITATPPALSRTVGVALTTSTLLLAATTAVVTPAGSNTQVQFNDAGVLGGDSGFTFIKATDAVAIAGATTVGGTLGVTGATTLSSTVATGALTVTGAATVSTTLGVTGLITSTGGITGGASSHTTGAFSSTVTGGTYNGQTISSAANFTGTVAVAGYVQSNSTTGTTSYFEALKGGVRAGLIGSSDALSGTSNHFAIYAPTAGGGSGGDVQIWSRGTLAATFGASQALTLTGLLTVSGFGTHRFSAGSTGGNILKVLNTTAGTGNYASFEAEADGAGGTLFLRANSTTFTPSGVNAATAAAMYYDASGGLSIGATHASGAIRFYSGGTTQRGQFSSGGIFSVGTTVVTSASAGEIVVPNNLGYRGVTAVGTGTVKLIWLDSNNFVQVSSGSGNVGIGLPVIATASIAAAGATKAGQILVDGTTAARFVFFDKDGNRYWVTGTSF